MSDPKIAFWLTIGICVFPATLALLWLVFPWSAVQRLAGVVYWFFVRLWYHRCTSRCTVRMIFDQAYFSAGDISLTHYGRELLYLGNDRYLMIKYVHPVVADDEAWPYHELPST